MPLRGVRGSSPNGKCHKKFQFLSYIKEELEEDSCPQEDRVPIWLWSKWVGEPDCPQAIGWEVVTFENALKNRCWFSRGQGIRFRCSWSPNCFLSAPLFSFHSFFFGSRCIVQLHCSSTWLEGHCRSNGWQIFFRWCNFFGIGCGCGCAPSVLVGRRCHGRGGESYGLWGPLWSSTWSHRPRKMAML